ncbi:VWA domain-containing protein [Hyphomonas johnsonii]|uniref:VWA domain-containing protein n=1 Tax=Hyphomonas johnsonii MHS-2 TaxID=1280950 RepID=A0A059FRQ8_9PROT|nr:VWA domain-containing protein [Hyphomonas johnsonii]KCZ93302.1 VWA domain-containing protein [Hyphomonas johnsonii MHS-2]
MERTLTNFIRALRSSDVRVSTGEALDATRAVALIGYQDRSLLKDSLGCVLAKSETEKQVHDRLFDLYFAHSDSQRGGSESSSETESTDGEAPASPEDLIALMESGDDTAISLAMERAAEAAGIDNIRFSTQVAYFAQQMVKQMGGDGLQERLLEALQGRGEENETRAQELIDMRRDLTMRARDRAERAFDVFGAGETDQFRNDFAAEKRLSALDQYDMERMKILIAKVAKRLAVKHSRRRRKRNRGQLDVRRTMRANAGLDGVPFNVIWRQKKRDRPKIVAICDVSGSVARYVRFLLLLLYSLADVVPDLHAFAFSNRLRAVDDILDNNEFEAAMTKIIRDLGMGSTDYGQAWSDLKVDHESIIDRRTTIIVLGDGRSNYGDPRNDLFQQFAQRAKQVIWLNPEARPLWGTGDSAIPRYLPYCTQMSHVATLKDLERAVDEVLSAYG